jgi:hypothetical protein
MLIASLVTQQRMLVMCMIFQNASIVMMVSEVIADKLMNFQGVVRKTEECIFFSVNNCFLLMSW